MEASSSSSVERDNEAVILEELLNVFGSEFSLEEIGSAFCKAGRNANVTADILYESRESGSHAASTTASNDVLIDSSSQSELSENIGGKMIDSNKESGSHAASTTAPNDVLIDSSSQSELCENIGGKMTDSNRNDKESRPKRVSVSIGTVSSVIGKDYSKSTMLANRSSKTTKPLKLNFNKVPMTELWGKESSLDSTVGKDTIHKDIEDFLYKMLGDGHQLSMDVIREVLGCCGYDMKQSIEKLLYISASSLKKSNDIIGGSAENSVDDMPPESQLCQQKSEHMDIPPRNKAKSLAQDKERYDIQKEVLASLFCVPERFEEPPIRSCVGRAAKKTRAVRHNDVFSCPSDTKPEFSAEVVETQQDIDDDIEEEDSYRVLRRVAKEHWLTTKEYYRTATDAFAEGNHSLAYKLLEQGQLYNDKAREADEKSAQKILEQSKKQNQDEVSLDLHVHDTKEAVRLLKCHLTSLSGIPAFLYLKVIVETDAIDATRGSRKRWVLKLLEKESIKWTEEDNGRTIVIRVDEINPKRLSFAKKTR